MHYAASRINTIRQCLPTAWFCLAIIVPCYAMTNFDSNDITQSDRNAQTSASKKTISRDTGRYAPVYGHIPYRSGSGN